MDLRMARVDGVAATRAVRALPDPPGIIAMTSFDTEQVVLDAVRAGDIPKRKVNDLGIIVSVWLDPSILDEPNPDFELLFRTNREATAKAIAKAMRNEPGIDWLLENQNKVQHYFHQLAVEGNLE